MGLTFEVYFCLLRVLPPVSALSLGSDRAGLEGSLRCRCGFGLEEIVQGQYRQLIGYMQGGKVPVALSVFNCHSEGYRGVGMLRTVLLKAIGPCLSSGLSEDSEFSSQPFCHLFKACFIVIDIPVPKPLFKGFKCVAC